MILSLPPMLLAVLLQAQARLPDPTMLPVASAQPPAVAKWAALRVASMSAGQSYYDPTTGVRIWKVSSASTPEPNTGAGHDYADGGQQVSRGWGNRSGSHTILVRVNGAPYWLVDFDRGFGLRNWRRLPPEAQPASDLCFTFANDPQTPRIAYIYNGRQLIRFNTAMMRVENLGGFPKTLPSGTWLQQDMNDSWFVKLAGENTVIAWNAKTGVQFSQSWNGINEGRLERNGRYVALGGGTLGTRIWDLQSNTVSSAYTGFPFAHNASPRGHWIATNWDLSAPWALERLDPTGGAVQIHAPSFGTDLHHSGSWIQGDAELGGDLLRQWTIASTYKSIDPRVLLQNAIGYVRSDGSDVRLLAHTYQAGDSYWSLPFATSSPDGRVVIFNSNMMSPAGRTDLFVIEVPAR